MEMKKLVLLLIAAVALVSSAIATASTMTSSSGVAAKSDIPTTESGDAFVIRCPPYC